MIKKIFLCVVTFCSINAFITVLAMNQDDKAITKKKHKQQKLKNTKKQSNQEGSCECLVIGCCAVTGMAAGWMTPFLLDNQNMSSHDFSNKQAQNGLLGGLMGILGGQVICSMIKTRKEKVD